MEAEGDNILKSDHDNDQQALQNRHKNDVKTAFINYEKDMKQLYSDIFTDQKLPHYYELIRQRKRQKLQTAIASNQKFLNAIIQFINLQQSPSSTQEFIPFEATACHNIPKIRTTVKQFYREWCSESPESQTYKMITQKVKQYLKKGDKIIVPGSGLGRLVLELVEAGFGAQGNEVTYFMLYGSNFILNCCQQKLQYEIYPFIHYYGNMINQEDIFRSVRVPDKLASEVVDENADFSMAAGQFTEIYGQQFCSFEGVITCFFIDTANNIFKYIDTIYQMLKQGGIWVNYGPLLYHYKDMLDQISIEISWDQLEKYIISKGFITEQKSMKKTSYCHDPKSTLIHQYNCLMTVWRKPQNGNIQK